MTDREFAEIINSTKGIVLSAIGKNLNGNYAHAIDDVVQETYLRAYRSLVKKKFKGDSSLNTWLYSIAKNESRRMNMRLSREEDKFDKKVEHIELFPREQETFNHEIYDLRESIAALPQKYRSVLELVARGFSVQDISKKLNIRAGTVKSRTSRGKDMLQKILREDVK